MGIFTPSSPQNLSSPSFFSSHPDLSCQVSAAFVPLRRLILLLILAGFIYLTYDLWASMIARPASLGGVPHQAATKRTPFQKGAYKIVPMAEFQLKARVLSRKDYSRADFGQVASQDLALAWGTLATDDRLRRRVSVSQSDRFAHYQTDDFLAHFRILGRIANVHIISATPAIERFVASLKAGDLVALSGCLVSAKGEGGSLTSSMTRFDSGAGACEVFYVERAALIEREDTSPATTSAPSRPFPPSTVSAQIGSIPAAREHTLRRPVTIELAHGTVTIPAQYTILIHQQTKDRTQITYQGFTGWVPTRNLE